MTELIVTGYSSVQKKIWAAGFLTNQTAHFGVCRLTTPQPAGGCGPDPGGGGSRGLVRLVAIKIPIPNRMMIPTTIQDVGTFSRYAPIASPTVTMMKPMRYVANEDMKERTKAKGYDRRSTLRDKCLNC